MSSWFGLDSTLIEGLVRRLRDGPEVDPAGMVFDAEGVREAFARAAWTMIAEPGDGVSGFVVAALGPAEALSAVIERAGPTGLQRRILASGWPGAGSPASSDADEPAAPPVSRVLGNALERWRPRLVSADLVAACETAISVGARLVLPGGLGWHPGLGDLDVHAPHALWLRGDPGAPVSDRSIAMVGARAASGYGEHVTAEAAAGLVDRAFTIVSGAAYGIDGAAHRAALGSGGTTVAYLAGGVDRPYPAGHDALIRRIRESGGAVVSESPCGSVPSKWRFLQRTCQRMRLLPCVNTEAPPSLTGLRRCLTLENQTHDPVNCERGLDRNRDELDYRLQQRYGLRHRATEVCQTLACLYTVALVLCTLGGVQGQPALIGCGKSEGPNPLVSNVAPYRLVGASLSILAGSSDA
jgi:hypothetical protein